MVDCGFFRACLQNGQLWQIAALTRAPPVGALMFLGGLGTLDIPVLLHLLTLPTELDAGFNRALPLLWNIPEDFG